MPAVKNRSIVKLDCLCANCLAPLLLACKHVDQCLLLGSRIFDNCIYCAGALQAAVETQRKYKHVLWYSLFVAAYLIVLYLQASAYNSGEVVSTLRQALMPGQPTAPSLHC